MKQGEIWLIILKLGRIEKEKLLKLQEVLAKVLSIPF